MRKHKLDQVAVSRAFKPVAHLNRQIPPEPHTAMYVWHKYWSRTAMTGGLLRGSNLPAATPKVMVLPEEREGDFLRKMQSPLFQQHVESEAWRVVYFRALRQAFTEKREATEIGALYDVRLAAPKAARVREARQVELSL